MLMNLDFSPSYWILFFLLLYLTPFLLERLNNRKLENWQLKNVFEINRKRS